VAYPHIEEASLDDRPGVGEPGADGIFPEGSFNRAVIDRLAEFAKAAEPQKDANAKGRLVKAFRKYIIVGLCV